LWNAKELAADSNCLCTIAGLQADQVHLRIRFFDAGIASSEDFAYAQESATSFRCISARSPAIPVLACIVSILRRAIAEGEVSRSFP
jgi:hypothetical protein